MNSWAPGPGIFVHAPCNITKQKNVILFFPKLDILKFRSVFIFVLKNLQEVSVLDTVKLYRKEVGFFPKKVSVKEPTLAFLTM